MFTAFYAITSLLCDTHLKAVCKTSPVVRWHPDMLRGRDSGSTKPSSVLSRFCCITQSTTAPGMKLSAFTGHLLSPSPHPAGTNTAPSTGEKHTCTAFLLKRTQAYGNGGDWTTLEILRRYYRICYMRSGHPLASVPLSPSTASSFSHWKGCTSCPGGPCGRRMLCWSTFRNKDAVPSTLGVPPAAGKQHSATSCLPFQKGRVTRKLYRSLRTGASLSSPDTTS